MYQFHEFFSPNFFIPIVIASLWVYLSMYCLHRRLAFAAAFLRIRTSALLAASVAARPVRHHHPVGCRCYLAPSSRVPSGTTIYRGVRVSGPPILQHQQQEQH